MFNKQVYTYFRKGKSPKPKSSAARKDVLPAAPTRKFRTEAEIIAGRFNRLLNRDRFLYSFIDGVFTYQLCLLSA